MDYENAEKLWAKLHASLLDVQTAIIEIIANKAWEPLGYNSFGECWAAKMDGISIAAEIRPHVVYQMITEGMTDDEIADAVKGVGPETVRRLAEQRAVGVPASNASVAKLKGRTPPKHSTLFISVPSDLMLRWKRLAKANSVGVSEFAYAAVQLAFEELGEASA